MTAEIEGYADRLKKAAPTADELLKMLGDKAATIKTCEVDYVANDSILTLTSTATCHWVSSREERDGQVVSKCLITSKTRFGTDGKTPLQESKFVGDGVFWWNEIRSPEKPGIMVYKLNARKNVDSSTLTNPEGVENLRNNYDMGAVGEDTIDEHKVFVLKATKKAGRPGSAETLEFYIDEDSLTVRRNVVRHPENGAVYRTEYSAYKLNGAVDPKIFVYTPPEGAVVEDRTKQAEK